MTDVQRDDYAYYFPKQQLSTRVYVIKSTRKKKNSTLQLSECQELNLELGSESETETITIPTSFQSSTSDGDKIHSSISVNIISNT